MVVPNADSTVSGRKMIQSSVLVTPAWADRFDNIDIPDEMSLVIKAAWTNSGLIYVARSRAEALSIETSYYLLPNEPVSYTVKNASAIWFAGTVAGDFVHFTIEQNKKKGEA